MNIAELIASLRAEIADEKNPEEAIGTYINLAQFTEHQQILDEIGDVDLSEPKPDLKAGWTTVRAQLACNALYTAVMRPSREEAIAEPSREEAIAELAKRL